jgi:hypothetical protein
MARYHECPDHHVRSAVVSPATRRLRSLLIALAVLALSATAVLAGRTMTTPQHQVASQRQGGAEQADGSESPDPSESEAPESSGAPGSPEVDTGDSASGVHPDNHGKLVSEAAQTATPDGFDNHGAYVKTIAQDNAGHAGAAARHAGKQH